MLGLAGDDQGVSRSQRTPQAHGWLLRSSIPLQGQRGCAQEFCRSKSKTTSGSRFGAHTSVYQNFFAGTMRSAAENVTLLAVKLKEMQGIPEDFNKILTTRSVLMHRVIQNFQWHWCCRYGYKNYHYTDHVLIRLLLSHHCSNHITAQLHPSTYP